MYELDFRYEPEKKRWVCEFERPRAHGLWAYVVGGSELSGVLSLLPGGEIARNVAAKREPPSAVSSRP
jgi:hypothetical protein